MAKFTAYTAETDAKEIAAKLIEAYPKLFGHIEVEKIGWIRNLKKTSKIPIKLYVVKYPHSIWNDNVYILEVFGDCWSCLESNQKNLAVAQAMFAIPPEGFYESSKQYQKLVKPNITTYLEVFAMAGGVPNFLENANAADPLAANPSMVAFEEN